MNLVVNGRKAYAYTGGRAFDPALPCVVFIHGALNNHGEWTLLARWFAHHGHAVLAPDLPGHSRSEGPALTSVEALADWCLGLLDAAGAERAIWVGHSMGSLIALEAAARAPERATALALLAMSYPMVVTPALLETSLKDPQAAIEIVRVLSLSSLAQKPSFPGPGTWLHGAKRAMMQRVLAAQEPELFHIDFKVCSDYANGLNAAARVTCATTLLLGEFDRMTPPRAARELGAALRAQVVTLPYGHALMAEGPDPVLNALRRALLPAGSPS